MTLIALVLSIILSTGSLAWGYAEVGLMFVTRWSLIFGALWLFAVWQNWKWFASVGLFASMLAAAFGLWAGFTPGWMIASGIFSLFAWDMTDFRRRQKFIAADDDSRGMERRHIARVSMLIAAGLFLATIATLLQVRFTFEWGVFLVAVAVLGLMQLFVWFQKK